MANADVTCGQAVSPDDDCCGSDGLCDQPATWVHRGSGAMLCDLHEGNARQYSHGGQWRVDKLEVSYPEGWEQLPPAAAEAAPVLEAVQFNGDSPLGAFEVDD